jgi:hypothetical protein
MNGRMTDNAIEEANLRKVMFSYAAKKYCCVTAQSLEKRVFTIWET